MIHHHLPIIVFALFVAMTLNLILKRFGMPPILGYILSGAVISNLFGLDKSESSILDDFSELGIVFLLFTIGLEFSVHQFKRMKKEVLLHGGLQMIMTTLLFATVGYYFFSLSLHSAIVIGLGMALSSTAIVLKFLAEKKEMQFPYGKQTLGILLMQDIAVIPILLFLSFLGSGEKDIGVLIGGTVVSALLAVVLLYILGKYVITYFLQLANDSKSNELFIGIILLSVLAACLVAHEFGFSYSLGAFLAGMILAESKFKYRVETELAPFTDILLGIFFLTVGLQIKIDFLVDNLGSVLLIMTLIMLLKAVVIFLILSFSERRITALKTALSLAQIGEFSFVVLEHARLINLLEQHTYGTLMVAVIFSMILTPMIMQFVIKIKSAPIDMKGIEEVRKENHVIICGFGEFGRTIGEKMSKQNIPFIAIDPDSRAYKEGSKVGYVILGDASKSDILKKAGIESAVSLIITVNDLKYARIICEEALKLQSHINLVVKIRDDSKISYFDGLAVSTFVNGYEVVSDLMVKEGTKGYIKQEGM